MRKIFNYINNNDQLKQLISIMIVLIVMIIVFSISSQYFFTKNNLLTIALQSSIITIISIGQTLVLITGGIDLSLGSVIGLSGMVSSLFMVDGMSIPIAIILGCLIATSVGLINGLLIVYGKLPPFVVTLGTMSIVKGINLLLTNGIPVSGLPKEFLIVSGNSLLGLSIPVWIMLLLTFLFHYMLTKTPLGLHIYASGSNIQAAKLSGINTNITILLVYIFSALLASIAGIVFASRVLSGQPTAGSGYELYAVASSVIGGTSLSGGEGIIAGTLVGSLIIGTLRNGLNLMGVSAFLQEVMIGCVIIAAVFIDKIKENFKK